jgi:hypothetical protein
MSDGMDVAAWLRGHGFGENPFALREADREERLAEYFIAGPSYDEIRGQTQAPETVLVFADRGCGKSAYRVMVERSCRPQRRGSAILAVPYVEFSAVVEAAGGDLTQVSAASHLQAILACGLRALLHEFVVSPQGFLSLAPARQRAFKALLRRYVPSLLHPIWLTDQLATWEQPQAAAFAEGALDGSDERCTLIQFLLDPDQEPLPGDRGAFDHWRFLIALARHAGMQAVYVLLDGLDEFAETAMGGERAIAAFLLPLVTHLAAMQTAGTAFKFFLPERAFDALAESEGVRFDRLRTYRIEWTDEHLHHMLTERLRAFSAGHVESLDALADVDLAGQVDRRLVHWAAGSPRKLLLVGDVLLAAHCARSADPGSLLTEADLQALPERFERAYGALVPPLHIDEQRGRVFIGRRMVPGLTPLEYDLLRYLYRHAGEVKSKEDVYDAVYQTTEGVTDQAMDSLVSRLRSKIEVDSKRPTYLLTLRGRGYRLVHTG